VASEAPNNKLRHHDVTCLLFALRAAGDFTSIKGRTLISVRGERADATIAPYQLGLSAVMNISIPYDLTIRSWGRVCREPTIGVHWFLQESGWLQGR
jgi:hypothetical protein